MQFKLGLINKIFTGIVGIIDVFLIVLVFVMKRVL